MFGFVTYVINKYIQDLVVVLQSIALALTNKTVILLCGHGVFLKTYLKSLKNTTKIQIWTLKITQKTHPQKYQMPSKQPKKN